MSRGKLTVVVVAVLSAMVLAVGSWAFTVGRPAVRSWRNPVERAHVAGPGEAVLIVGDSYTAGVGADRRTDGYAFLASRQMGWDATIIGETAAGYAWRGLQGDTLAKLVDQTEPARVPRLVVLAGGFNDARPGIPQREITDGFRLAVSRVRIRWPSAVVVALGPLQNGSADNPTLDTTDRALARTADELRVRYVTAVRWIADDRLIASDGIHPNEAGHRQEAARLIRELR